MGGYVFALREYQNLYHIAVDEMHLLSTISFEDIGRKCTEENNPQLPVDESTSLLPKEE